MPVLVPLLLLLTLAGAATPACAETRAGDAVTVADLVDDDLYAAGGQVRISSSVAGDATVGAGTLDISGDIEGDALLAGGQVGIDGGVGDDLRVVGGDVTLRGFVIDHATIAGGNVTLAEESAIGGRTWIAAGTLEMAGQVGDDLRVLAGTAIISGQVDGDAYVTARQIRIEQDAVIGGDLIWRSETPPEIAEGAQILGGVVPADESGQGHSMEPSGPLWPGFALGLAVFMAALVLLWLSPGLVARSASALQAAPGRTLLLGAAALALVPLGALVLFVTVLGWLLGLLLLTGFFFAVILAGLLGLLIVVHLLRARFPGAGPAGVAPGAGGWRSVVLLALATGAAIAAQTVPVAGTAVNLLLLLAGMGALTALLTGRAAPPGGSPVRGGGGPPDFQGARN